MLVFDDGNFSESETVLLSDAMAHLPPEVLSKNFGVAELALKNLPKRESFIFQTAVPGPLQADRIAAAGAMGKSPTDFAFRTMEMPPTKRTKGGEVRIVDSNTFKVSTNIAMAMVTVHPGGLRELHWHPNADEWQYVIEGQFSVSMFGSHGRYRTETLYTGDVAYIPQGYGHSVENIGSKPARMLLGFNTGHYQAIDLSQWVAGTPTYLLADNVGKPETLFEQFPTERVFIAPPDGHGQREIK